MSDAETSSDAPFDFDRLLTLVELMEKHGLTEISLQRGSEKWRLRRGQESTAPVINVSPPSLAPALAAPANAAPGSAPPEPKNDGTVTINSPTVGTFYSSPTPDDPPFVSVGSVVLPEAVVCIVEAMKVFNQIPAEVSGTVVEVLAKNGDSVEFGQPLFRVRPG
ncbi:MAG TPA: acetyl-CoA carboxylase biotin carboxyl carrier protein [Planctomycetaceae bacterium]|jgi:acetyl-CoA carboxylase biotin carboxyl carrier protein|nr:acetyl-CoA carboxylase biotin carboxyl carrier protein [Planctomycetaceae bacterium]